MLKHTQEMIFNKSKIGGVEATLDIFRRRNTELESKLSDCGAEGISNNIRELEKLKDKLSNLERGDGAKDQEKIDEIRYLLRLRLEFSEKERKIEAASCTESRALIIPEKRPRRGCGKVVMRDTMTDVFGDKPLQSILRDTLLMNANANMLPN